MSEHIRHLQQGLKTGNVSRDYLTIGTYLTIYQCQDQFMELRIEL